MVRSFEVNGLDPRQRVTVSVELEPVNLRVPEPK